MNSWCDYILLRSRKKETVDRAEKTTVYSCKTARFYFGMEKKKACVLKWGGVSTKNKCKFLMCDPYSLGARWIHAMLGDPLENHWINVADGKVESLSEKPKYQSPRHLGEQSIILPATINAHAHLELSQLKAPLEVPSRSMSDWVAALLAFRRSLSYNAKQGIQQALCRPEFLESTIAVADIETAECRMQTAAEAWIGCNLSSAVRRFAFVELIAWRRELIPDVFPSAYGLSPHAPHTVCPALLEKAIDHNVPIAMHLAETWEERQLLQNHTGPLLDMMRRADADYDPKSVLVGKRPMDYLQLLSAAPSALIIHGNYLDDEELQFLAAHRETMSVVYCPRSHAYFRHAPYPLKKMLECGVRVLLGTDSLASVPDLSLLEEIRFVLKHHPRVAPEQVYRMGTLEGAAALPLLPEGFGTIQPCGPAQFAVL
jgi:cytosine/adenosine deaminase-related metal-dependent hydrolase